MKKLKLLWMILKRTKATQILSGYIVFLFVSAAIIQLVEPDINRYGDALGIDFVKMISVNSLKLKIYLSKNHSILRACISLETPYLKAFSHFPIVSHLR